MKPAPAASDAAIPRQSDCEVRRVRHGRIYALIVRARAAPRVA